MVFNEENKELNGISYRIYSNEKNDLWSPLLLTPVDIDLCEIDFLEEWLEDNNEWVQKKLLKYGALIFRGFNLENAKDFENVAKAASKYPLVTRYLGSSPRKIQDGTKSVFNSTDLNKYYPIPNHCEDSYLQQPAKQIFFACLNPVDGIGGETCLSNFQNVYRDLPNDTRERYNEGKIKIIRNYNGKESKKSYDPFKYITWNQIYSTDDKETVRKLCEEEHQTCEFDVMGKDSLRITHVQEAFVDHPITGEKVYHNHSQTFHSKVSYKELFRIAKLHKKIFMFFLAFIVSLFVFIRNIFVKKYNLPLHVVHEDGTEIKEKDIDTILDLIWENMFLIKWEKGDVFMLDNYIISHGRIPYYKNGRRILVCFSY